MFNHNEHGTQDPESMNPGEFGLHGDVILECTKAAPAGFDDMVEVKDACLAYGEVTGHAHRIMGEPQDFILREDPKTKIRHLRVINPVMLKHEEHSPVKLPPGDYRIGIQREYSPWEKRSRQVQD